MPEGRNVRIVTALTEEPPLVAFEEYTEALGKVAFAWNSLLERLAMLFAAVSGMDAKYAFAVWSSIDSDRTQQGMLRAIIDSSEDSRWPRHPKAKKDLQWLIKAATDLGNDRNNAVHAPCKMMLLGEKSLEMQPFSASGHKRAKNLQGKDILVEFDWCTRWAYGLSHFTALACHALTFGTSPWPDRPQTPDRQSRKALQAQHRKKLALQPRSSRT
jgi:hypothetical protein